MNIKHILDQGTGGGDRSFEGEFIMLSVLIIFTFTIKHYQWYQMSAADCWSPKILPNSTWTNLFHWVFNFCIRCASIAKAGVTGVCNWGVMVRVNSQPTLLIHICLVYFTETTTITWLLKDETNNFVHKYLVNERTQTNNRAWFGKIQDMFSLSL